MPLLHCPELELRHSPSSWEPFIPRQAAPELDTSIDLLELRARDVKSLSDSGATYKRGLNHQDLVEHMNGMQGDEKWEDPLFRILFVNGHLSRPQELVNFNDVRPSVSSETAEFLHEHLGVSPSFLAVMIRKSWDLKSGNCQWVKAISCETGHDYVVEGWYRYSCGLKSFPSYVWYSYTSKCTTYLVSNCEYNGAQDAIVRCVEAGMANSLLRPLAVDGFIAEATTEGWGEAMRLPRLTLIKYEQFDEQNVFVDTRESVRELHVLSYNLIVIKEDMTDNIDRLEYLLDVHKTLETLFAPATPHQGIKVSHSLAFLLSENRIRRRWAECYSNRTGIQINLWYNLSSQRDNQTNLKIADFSSKIATETQKDSSSMITMAAVTMAFLPGTFVSALFSMVFFDTSTSPDGRVSLSVGASWWLFPVITIPLTILVFAIWHFWRKRRNATQMRELTMMETRHGMQENLGPGAYRWVPNHGHSIPPSIAPSINYSIPNAQGSMPDWGSCPPSPFQVPIPSDIFSREKLEPTPQLSSDEQSKWGIQPIVSPDEKLRSKTSLDRVPKEKDEHPVETPAWSRTSYPSTWYTPAPAPPPLSASLHESQYYDTAFTPPRSPTTSQSTAPFLPPLDPYSMARRPPVMAIEQRRAPQKFASSPSKTSGPHSIADPRRAGEAARAAEPRNRERFYVRNAAMTLEDLHDERSHRTQVE